ncbi:MAG: S41 family peptidase [Balneolaceae bacterium]|nr:S41 family peptidase [Balneolaceae bacterium]
MKNVILTGLFLALLIALSPAIVPAGNAAAQDGQVTFASEPTVSPDGSTVVFSYESDLWRVPASGGTAVRLTGMDGEEAAASISPDGSRLAFTSNQYGNDDVYIMPLEGGPVTRLTYHQAGDQVEGWNWDSEQVYFRSDRENRVSVYAVSPGGGTPERLFGHYHNTVHNLAPHPDGETYYFNESWESLNQVHRQGYRGPYNPDIKSYNTSTGAYAVLTDWEGKDLWPIFDRSGTLWFASDEANGQYNLYRLDEDGSKERLTRFGTSIWNPAVSADGSTIVFEREYQLYTYNTASGNTRRIPINIYRNSTLAKEQSFSTEDNVEAFDVSPDQKKLAFVSRGELFVSDAEGKFIRMIDTNPMGRVLEVKWMDDNRTLVFNQTVDGYQNWFTVAADGSGQARQLTDDSQNNRMLALNPDRTQGVYLSGRDELRLLDLETLESETIVEDEFWGFQNQQPVFSANGEYILYTARRDFEHDIFAYHVESGETTNLTNTGVSENSPLWSPDGRYIYFSSTRTAASYPRGGGDTDLYRMALDKYEEPYRSERFDEMFAEEADSTAAEGEEDSGSATDSSITINTEGLMDRLEQIGPGFGSQNPLHVLQEDETTHLLFLSNHDEGQTSLWVTSMAPFEQTRTRKVEGVNWVSSTTEVDGQVYGLSGGAIYKINVSGASASEITTDHDFRRNLRAEFDQMFEELWANIQENFYHETLHDTDWEEVRDRYRGYLPHVNSRNDFSRMMNMMLGELNSSHLGFSTFGAEEQEYHETVTLATGILFEDENPYTVSRIVSDSPADVTGKDIQAGDVLTAVNGKVVDHGANRERYFSRPSMESEITLTFERGGEEHSVDLHPTSYFGLRTSLYDEWVDRNQQVVDEKSGERVAYVHMKNMGGGALQSFLEEMTSEAYQRDALILDLRYNTGGNVHDAVLEFLSRHKYLEWRYREGDNASQPNFTPADKPIILLQNEQSLSDAEVTAAGFKELGLGTVMGNESYNWIIFTSGKGLVDGSFYRLPSWGVYTLEGQNLEKIGVSPDIYVDNTFKDRLDGDDPQLMRAIEEAMSQMGDN